MAGPPPMNDNDTPARSHFSLDRCWPRAG